MAVHTTHANLQVMSPQQLQTKHAGVTDLLVDGSIEVVVYIQVHKLPAVILGHIDVFTIVLEGHSQGLANARHACCEVLAEDVFHTLCACIHPAAGMKNCTNAASPAN